MLNNVRLHAVINGFAPPALVPQSWCGDGRLSLAARGLLLTLSAGDAGTMITDEWVADSTTSGADEIGDATAELRGLGYLVDEGDGHLTLTDPHGPPPQPDYGVPFQRVAPPPPKPPKPIRVALYRQYDVDDVLLYVGISVSPGSRFDGHSSSAVWFPFAHHATWEWYPDRPSAEVAEIEAIRAELPLFNVDHARPGTSDRAAEYLREHAAPLGSAR